MKYDLIVVGGGPAGYVAAIRAAQVGKKAVCVEMDRAGGTCLNWGCIPTKALLKNAEVYDTVARRAAEFGLKFDNLTYDWSAVVKRSRRVSDKLAGGVEMLLKKNKVDYVRGVASVSGPGKVSVKDAEGKESVLEGDRILLATGCRSRELPFLPYDGKRVISSKEALVLAEQPKSIIIVGAGAIGAEFAYFFNAYGTSVTMVEMMPNLLPVEDTEVSGVVEKAFKKQGIVFHTSTRVPSAKVTDTGVEVEIEGKDGGKSTLTADLCLVAVGVQPVLPEGIKDVKLTDRGYIQTNDRYETSVKGVFAAGDIIGPPWLAHVASYEAVQAVNGMFEKGFKPKKTGVFPGCTYCHPQVASIGLTERAAKEKGLKFKVGKFPLMASGKALALGEPEGFVKLLFGEPYGEIIGAHLVGDSATELLAGLGLAMNLEATREDIEATMHAHPTISEAIHEATGMAYGHAINI